MSSFSRTLLLCVQVLCTIGGLARPACCAPANTEMPPNIVLIIADDMNWDDCGAMGHPSIRTPNIDQLAASGILFQRAYLTTSSCSPSRASIITGRYPHNTGAEQLHWPLPAGTATIASVLRKSGYYTAAAGKWHMGDNIRDHFDRIYEASTAGFVLPTGDQQGEPMVAAQPSGCEDWQTAITERDPKKPFFLWLAALDPHREYTPGALEPPHQLHDVLVPAHLPDTPEVREDLRQYYDEIGRLDQYVGRVVDCLRQEQIFENTLIIFLSDNGRPFPRDKTTLYDGGIRTPFFVSWPAQIRPGQRSASLVSVVDIAPTLCAIAGVDSGELQCDGQDFCRLLQNPAFQYRQFAFAEDHWHDFEDHCRSITDGRFKLIRNDYPDLAATPSADALRASTWQTMLQLNGRNQLTPEQQGCFLQPRPHWELYDLQHDPGEYRNLAGEPAWTRVMQNLQQELEVWTTQTADYVPSIRTPDEFDRVTGAPDPAVRVRPRPSRVEMFGTNGQY